MEKLIKILIERDGITPQETKHLIKDEKCYKLNKNHIMKGQGKMDNLRGLWRGINPHTKEWVVGTRLDKNNIGIFHEDTETEDCYVDIFQIDPSTLGECTGTRDINKKLIFEGDVVTTKQFNTPNKKYVVKYATNLAAFICVDISDELHFITFDCDADMFEVVGNIYDNKH